MTLLALDVATTTGFAAGLPGAQPPMLQWGARDFGGRGQSNGQIISVFRAWFNQRCYDMKPRLVVYESIYLSPTSMNSAVPQRLYGMTGQIEATCVDLGIECRQVTTQEFTKFMTGQGRFPGKDAAARRKAKKEAVIKACRWYGCEVDDDNEADAVGIWLFTESIVNPRASEHRRRLAADREREQTGAGPLFVTEAA